MRLVVVGDGPLRPVYERQIDPDARPYVHFAGRLNRTGRNHLVTGDIFCTPCNSASFGMVLLEAMSCGQPVVASRISGFQLLMEHGRQGMMVSPADAADRSRPRSAVARRAGERARMGDQGRRTPSSGTPGRASPPSSRPTTAT